MTLQALLNRIPEGYSTGQYESTSYGITKSLFNGGQSVKLYAEVLGGTDFVSLNLYHTDRGEVLKPCEMPPEKVIAFLKGVENVEPE